MSNYNYVANFFTYGKQLTKQKKTENKRKKGLLLAKQKQAEAQEKIYQTIEGIGDSSGAIETLERVEEKVETMQAKAEAYQEISNDSEKESLERKFTKTYKHRPTTR